MTTGRFRKMKWTDGFLMSALLLFGGFHEYISCALSAVMCIYLLLRVSKTGKLQIQKSLLTLAVSVLCLFYGLTCLWAIDSGMAFVGFLKFLPLVLYLLCLHQEQGKPAVLAALPYLACVMTAISVAGMHIPGLRSLFSVADRLGGFFQYPNTFAIFLLVSELLLLKKENKKLWDWLALFVLVGGILYTGSRTAFVIFLVANAGMIFVMGSKTVKYAMAGILGTVCVLAVALALSGNPVAQRYLQISFSESTFVGRLLYVQDALPLLLKYPFGMGYMGYYYIQNSIQTGVYDVMFIHNDFMQFVLDVGLIPGGLLIGTVIVWLCKKHIPVADKILVGALCLHSLFDFDLQFIGVSLLLILLLWENTGKKPIVVKKIGIASGAFVLLAVISIYIGAALMLSHMGQTALSDRLYPYNTQNKLKILSQTEDLTQANELADAILEQNTTHFAPYSAKAKYSYSKGDFSALIQYKQQVFVQKPFAYAEYEEYCQMLINGIALYQQMGDQNSIKICKKELIATQKLLEENRNRLSKLGSMIADQPITELPDALQAYIDQLGGAG